MHRCLIGPNELGSRIQENLVALTEFLAEPFVTVIPTTPGVARHYGRVYAALRRAGTPIPANDMWIAAATLETGACPVTFDADFARVRGPRLRRARGVISRTGPSQPP